MIQRDTTIYLVFEFLDVVRHTHTEREREREIKYHNIDHFMCRIYGVTWIKQKDQGLRYLTSR
jgi:hypothetical protein